MKKIILLSFSLICLGLAGLTQQKKEESDKGYWVIENNIKTPRQSVVYFYTPENQLVYKETVIGRKLNVSRRRICKRLNAVLEQSILAWKNNKAMKTGQQLVLRH